jgi:hypothetical protein
MRLTNEESEQLRIETENENKQQKKELLKELPAVLKEQIKAKQNPHFVLQSLKELLNYGYSRTGHSSKAGKVIWTNQLAGILDQLHVEYETGNDAPRKGGNGEYIKVNAAELNDRIIYFELVKEL